MTCLGLLLRRAGDVEQAGEELVEQSGGLLAVGQLVAAEPVDLVARQLEGTVTGDHLRVALGVGALLVVGVVLDTVEQRSQPMFRSKSSPGGLLPGEPGPGGVLRFGSAEYTTHESAAKVALAPTVSVGSSESG
jgi:hypothetical protein